MKKGALSEVKVVEYASFVSGPFCTKLMADLGAEVIKVEQPGQGDEARRWGPFLKNTPHPERSGLFLYLNTNKLGITLNLKSLTGKGIFKELVRRADILVENNPPQIMRELGLDYESLNHLNPRLIMTSITPFGQSGPYRDYKGSDLIAFQTSSMGYATPGLVDNPAEEPPLRGGGHLGDMLAGLQAAIVTLGVLHGREATGRGVHIDVSEQEALATNMGTIITHFSYHKKVEGRAKSESSWGGGGGAGGLQPCKDGYVQIHFAEEHMWRAFLELLGNPEWGNSELFRERALRAKNWNLLEPRIQDWTMQRTKEEVYRACQAKRIPCAPVNTTEDLVKSTDLAARGFFVDIEHSEAGRLKYPGVAYKFSATPYQAGRSAPLLGEHNEDILCGRLGYRKAELVKMREAGVV